MQPPRYIAHADWGTDPKKRQVALAQRAPERGYHVISLAPALSIEMMEGDLRKGLHLQIPYEGQLLAGFDFPIGFPRDFAAKAGIGRFPGFLPEIGHGQWRHFADVAERPEEITLQRPFYPARPGGTLRAQLSAGLGLTNTQLRRRCDGNDAETMFWTLGGKQVGRAALAGWRYLSAGSANLVDYWPFAGPLPALLDGDPDHVVVTETYPREYYRHFRSSLTASGSKRKRQDRLRWIPRLFQWADQLGVTFEPPVHVMVASGFSDGVNGEDEFDAVVGLLGMVGVVTGALESGEPVDDPAVFSVEGWILGRVAIPGHWAAPAQNQHA